MTGKCPFKTAAFQHAGMLAPMNGMNFQPGLMTPEGIQSLVAYLNWLVVEPYPSQKYESQLGLFFPIYGKKIMFQTIKQILYHHYSTLYHHYSILLMGLYHYLTTKESKSCVISFGRS